MFKRNDPYGDAEKQQEKCRYPIRIKRHDISPSRSRNGIKFKLRHVPIFGRSAAAQQNMPRYRLMGSHQRFSVLVAKYGATTNVLQPERHSRYQYSFVDVRRNALRRRQIGVKLICSGSWTKYPEAALRRSRLARGIRLSSDSAAATSREDHRSPRSDPAAQHPRWGRGLQWGSRGR